MKRLKISENFFYLFWIFMLHAILIFLNIFVLFLKWYHITNFCFQSLYYAKCWYICEIYLDIININILYTNISNYQIIIILFYELK